MEGIPDAEIAAALGASTAVKSMLRAENNVCGKYLGP